MAARLLIVQNDPDKGLGRIADALSGLDMDMDVRVAASGLPDLEGYDGLVVLPGLANPVDDTDSIYRARTAIDQALARQLPVLGLCLGGQLLVQALGGSVHSCPPELGILPVSATAATASDPLLQDAPDKFDVFHAHTYAFTPPPEATVLLENDVCIQACRIGNTWAFQCHPEVSREWVGALASAIRGTSSDVAPETASFFRHHTIDPDQLEGDAHRANDILDGVAYGIAQGFASQCRARERA